LAIPFDSQPIEEVQKRVQKESECDSDTGSSFEEFWGEHFFPRASSFAFVDERPPVLAAGVKILVFDLIGTIFVCFLISSFARELTVIAGSRDGNIEGTRCLTSPITFYIRSYKLQATG
jgi:hypothetical protein